MYYIALLLTVAKKRVCAPVAHKIEYVPMHTIREITRLATMLAGLIAPRLRSPGSIVARHAITLIVRLGTQYTIKKYVMRTNKYATNSVAY